MRSSGTVPEGAVHLDDLAPIADRRGPFLTVYLTTEGGVENAGHRSQQRWKTLRSDLEAQGAPAGVLDLIDPLVRDAHIGGDMLAIIADESGILVAEHADEPHNGDRGTWGRAPDLLPLVRARQRQLPHVVALVDRGGADLMARAPGTRPVTRTAGDDDPSRKVHPGGFSQRRYQQRAEEDWEATAAEVASEIRHLAGEVGARLVIIGGDVTAAHLIHEALRDELAELTHIIEPGRAVDGSEEARREEILRLVAEAEEADANALLEKFAEERGQDDRAAVGIVGTVDALNRAAVEVLFVTDDRSGRAFVGETPVPLVLDRDDAVSDQVHEVPLTDAMVLGAVSTGARVRVLDDAEALPEGTGALLRWSNGA